MLRSASGLFRHMYWLVLNLPFFLVSLAMSIATLDATNLISKIILTLNSVSVAIGIISIVFWMHVLTLLQTNNIPNKNVATIIKPVDGHVYALSLVISAILISVPAYAGMNWLYLILELAVIIGLYTTELGGNCKAIPAYLFTIFYPCYEVSVFNSDNTAVKVLSYVADDTMSAELKSDNVYNTNHYFRNGMMTETWIPVSFFNDATTDLNSVMTNSIADKNKISRTSSELILIQTN